MKSTLERTIRQRLHDILDEVTLTRLIDFAQRDTEETWPVFMTRKTAMRYLDVSSEATFHRWRKDGLIPAASANGKGPIRYDRREIDRLWITSVVNGSDKE